MNNENFEQMMITYMATEYIVNELYKKDASSKGMKFFHVIAGKDESAKEFSTEEMFNVLLKHFNPYLVFDDKLAIYKALEDQYDAAIIQKLLSTCDARLNESDNKYDIIDLLLSNRENAGLEKVFELGLRVDDEKQKTNLIEMALISGNQTFFQMLRQYQDLMLDIDEMLGDERYGDIIVEELGRETNVGRLKDLNALLIYLKDVQAENLATDLNNKLEVRPQTKSLKI